MPLPIRAGSLLNSGNEVWQMETKRCPHRRCVHRGKLQPVSHFTVQPHTKDGLCHYCQDCMKRIGKLATWHNKGKTKLLEIQVIVDPAEQRQRLIHLKKRD